LLVAAQRLQRNLVLAEVHAVEDVQEKKEMNDYTVATFSKTELNLCASMITAAKEDFIALQKKTTGPLQSSSKASDRFRGEAATLGDGNSTETDCSVVDVISSASSPVNSIVSPMSPVPSLSPRLEMETLQSARTVLVGMFGKREKKDVYFCRLTLLLLFCSFPPYS
tara:strand:- start:55 stop:555 length:501 start_codon:yes stop_codon:yes gene_type:complete